MGAWFPSAPVHLTDGLLFLLVTLSFTTRSYSEDWCPFIYGDSDPLTLPTILSLAFQKCVNCSSEVKKSPSKPGSSFWYNMTWILELLDVTSLIHNSVSVDELITTVENISSNTTCYCG